MSRFICDNSIEGMRYTIEKQLEELGKLWGHNIKLGKCKYLEGMHATFELICSELDENGNPKTPEIEDLKHYSTSVGLSPSNLGDKFWIDDRVFTIKGWRRENPKNPIICSEESTSRLYKMNVQTVIEGLKKNPYKNPADY